MGADREVGPFRKAASRNKRAKIFLWGDSGVGKTTLGLQFPGIVILDLEGGTDLYGDSFCFDVLQASTADEVMRGVDWLCTGSHGYKTLMVDPITVYWDALQYKWSDIFLKRNQGSKGFKHEFYDLQPRDWMTLKAEFKELIRKLISLDMNVIVTARQKALYADSGFMKKIGETFDGEKSLPYLFDTIVRMYRDEKGRFVGECLKDRANKLPRGEFECSFQVFDAAYGLSGREPVTSLSGAADSEQRARIQEACRLLRVSDANLNRRLADYGAKSIDELSADAAATIIKKLEVALRSSSQGDLGGSQEI